ncbi:MAG: hypothetical protein ACLSB9_29640 [Hydrogeniiclostridium mannosilyticum]
MNFTNSPYERMMKEIPHPETPLPQKAPDRLVRGVLIGRDRLCFLLPETPQKAGVM